MSDSIKHLSYKFQRLREEIRGAIAAGDLAQKLPGERELARRFGVNAKTISKALTDLTSEGLLIRHVGRGTFVADQERADRQVGKGRQYVWLAPAHLEPSLLDAMFQMARIRLEDYGHGISLEKVSVDEQGELPERCVPIGRLKNLAGVIVFSSTPSRALLADLHRRHLPVVLCNTCSSYIKSNAVMSDYARGGFELTEHLLQLGHTQIRLIVDQAAHGSAEQQIQRGYLTAMARYQVESSPHIRANVEDIGLILDSQPQPTGIVCLGGHLVRAIKDHFQENIVAIPQLVSLVVMAQPGQLSAQQESITSYDVYPDRMLDWAIQLLFDYTPGSLPREVVVPGVFVDRGSTGAWKATQVTPHEQHIIL